MEYPNYIYKDSNDQYYIVDISLLSKTKEEIIDRYEKENLSKLEINSVNYLKDLSDISDRYVLNIVEEEMELYDEYMKKGKVDEDVLYELIDVISYLCSLLQIINKQLFYSEIDNEITCDTESFYQTRISITDIIGITDNKGELKNTIMESTNSLIIEYRRKFLERKWHKKVSRKLSLNKLMMFFDDLRKTLSDIIKMNIKLFLILTNEDYTMFNKMYYMKNRIVLDTTTK